MGGIHLEALVPKVSTRAGGKAGVRRLLMVML